MRPARDTTSFDRRGHRLRWLGAVFGLFLLPAAFQLVEGESGRSASQVTATQTEIITSTLAADGTVNGVEVTEVVRLAGPEGRARAVLPAGLENVRAADGTPKPREIGNGVGVYVDLAGPNEPVDVYLSGEARRAGGGEGILTADATRLPPLDVETSFTLDGRRVTDLDSIRGQSGHFEMDIRIENRSAASQLVEVVDPSEDITQRRKAQTWVPLTVKIGPMILDSAHFANVRAENALAATVQDGTAVTSSAVLFPPVLPAELDVHVEADTSDFAFEGTRVVATVGIDAEQPTLVESELESGSGNGGLLEMAIKEIEAGLATQTATLAESAAQLEQLEELAELSLLSEAGSVIRDELLPALAGIADADVDEQVGQLGVLVDTLGVSGYSQPVCRPDLPPARCTLSSYQAPLLPAQTSLDSVDGMFSNPGPEPKQGPGVERRVAAGATPNDLLGTAQSSGSYVGSLYNWAAMLALSATPAVDGDLDGTPDFAPFVWPDPNTHADLYTTQALDAVAIPKGSLYPGSGLPQRGSPGDPDYHPVIPGVNPTFPRPGTTFETICTSESAFDVLIPLGPLTFEIEATTFGIDCPIGGVPQEDITLRDLLDGSAQDEIGRATLSFDDFLVKAPLVGGDYPSVDMEGYIDLGDLVLQQPGKGLANVLELASPNDGTPAGITFTITCTSTSTADSPQKAGELPSPLLTGAFLMLLCGEEVVDRFAPPDMTQTYNQFGFRTNGAPIVQLGPLLDIVPFGDYDVGCFWPLPLLVRDGAQFKCDDAFAGQLRVIQAIGEGIRDDLYNPSWNFYNYMRGDPGFLPSDISSPTRPGLAQRLDLVLFEIDRAAARCPAQLTDIPTRRAPRLTVPCSSVLPNDGSTLVGSLDRLIADDIGNPSARRFAGGNPADLATALGVLADYLVTIPGQVGTLDASGANRTILGSSQAVSDIFDELVGRFENANTTTGRMGGSLAVRNDTAQLATAQSQRGLELAEDFDPFFGPARVAARGGGGESAASVETIFVFLAEGTSE